MKATRTAFLVFATLTVLFILWQFREAVVLFLLSFALAAAIRPLIERLIEFGLNKGLALILAYVFFLVILAGIFLVGNAPLATDIQLFTDFLINRFEWVKNVWLQSGNTLLVNIANQLPETKNLFATITGQGSMVVLQSFFGFAQGAFAFLARIAMIIALSLYWSADHVRFERLWLSLLPWDLRVRARKILQSVERGVGAYIGREATLSLLFGLLLWGSYLLLHVKYASLIALIGTLARLIPWLGALVVILLPIIIGSTLGWWAGLLAAFVSLLLLYLLERIIGRHFFDSSRVNSILLIVVVIAMTDSFGLIGAILATVLAVSLEIIFKNIMTLSNNKDHSATGITVDHLKEKLTAIQQTLLSEETQHQHEAVNLADRLMNIMEKLTFR